MGNWRDPIPMTMRLIKLPADLIPLTAPLTDSFQYPENEAWGVQTDEKEQMIENGHWLSASG